MVGKGTIISNVDCEHMQLQAMRALLPTIRNHPFFLFFSKTLHSKSTDQPISLSHINAYTAMHIHSFISSISFLLHRDLLQTPEGGVGSFVQLC